MLSLLLPVYTRNIQSVQVSAASKNMYVGIFENHLNVIYDNWWTIYCAFWACTKNSDFFWETSKNIQKVAFSVILAVLFAQETSNVLNISLLHFSILTLNYCQQKSQLMWFYHVNFWRFLNSHFSDIGAVWKLQQTLLLDEYGLEDIIKKGDDLYNKKPNSRRYWSEWNLWQHDPSSSPQDCSNISPLSGV